MEYKGFKFDTPASEVEQQELRNEIDVLEFNMGRPCGLEISDIRAHGFKLLEHYARYMDQQQGLPPERMPMMWSIGYNFASMRVGG